MNDDALPPAVPAAIPSREATADAAQPAARHAAAHRRWWFIGLALLVAAVLAAAYMEQRRQVEVVRAQLEQQHKSIVAEVETALAAARREAEQTRNQVAQLDQALAELKAQRADLDQLYLELSRGRDEAALIDVERMINLAVQELQIAGNVGAALTALQTADGRLARLNRPQLTPLRRALARDIDRLGAIAPLDITGNALRLDQLVRQVDTLPMLADPAARLPVTKPAPASAPIAPASPPDERPWARFRAWLAREFGDLVQLREVAAPESVLLSGQQQQAVRERLRLRVLDARQSLLARNERLYRADLAEAQALLARFFDVKAPATQQMLAQLKQLAALTLTLEPPSLADSLEALRAVRPGATR